MHILTALENRIWASLNHLIQYIESEDYQGYDPYDALNSPILQYIGRSSKLLKIIFTQGLRRLPFNLRPLLMIQKGHNPKGLGLFLTGYTKLLAITNESHYHKQIIYLTELLERSRSDNYQNYCWGYNFPWQNRNQLFPPGNPTIVNTCFIGHGFLDAYELLNDAKYLKILKSACNFILHNLQKTYETPTQLCLGYTPVDNERIYNANILGASFLARVFSLIRDEELIIPARKMVQYVSDAQNDDGSWYYGAKTNQKWIDLHHTGFVLENLYNFARLTDDQCLFPIIAKGLHYFTQTFIMENGRPRLWHNRDYPTDIHAAQAIVTLVKLHSIHDHSRLLERLVIWMIDNLQSKQGYFYYQKGRYFTNKISYMRWSQAWAFHALTTYLYFLKMGCTSPSH
ncbi:delta-aminolevulinic acid dehydratase [candidate division KSB1 bacterium]|nr:delta-aminolevulinic acid dehydratase [candidate division KSB1 bacterium]